MNINPDKAADRKRKNIKNGWLLITILWKLKPSKAVTGCPAQRRKWSQTVVSRLNKNIESGPATLNQLKSPPSSGELQSADVKSLQSVGLVSEFVITLWLQKYRWKKFGRSQRAKIFTLKLLSRPTHLSDGYKEMNKWTVKKQNTSKHTTIRVSILVTLVLSILSMSVYLTVHFTLMKDQIKILKLKSLMSRHR